MNLQHMMGKDNRMYIDAWQWIYDYQRQIRAEGDARKQAMVAQFLEAKRIQQDSPSTAYDMYSVGHALAKQVGEPCWVLLFEYYSLHTLLYYMHDHQRALDYAVRVLTHPFKDHMTTCNPIRAKLLYTLADAHFEYDAIAYADKITEMLDYIEDHLLMDKDTHLRLMTLRADLHIEFDRYAAAEDQVHTYLALSEGNNSRLYSAHSKLCYLSYVRGDLSDALHHARTATTYALRKNYPQNIAHSHLWQAVVLQWMGSNDRAAHMHQLAHDRVENEKLDTWVGYFSLRCEYEERRGNIEMALHLRQQALQRVQDYNSLHYDIQTHLHACRLYGRVGHPLDEMLTVTRALIAQATKPAIYRDRLQHIEGGDYYEFDWQREADAPTV